LLPFIAIAVAIVILVFGIGMSIKAFSSTSTLLMIIGSAVMILTFIYAVPAALQGDFTRQKAGFVLAIFSIGLVLVLLSSYGVIQTGLSTTSTVYAIPHMASYKCDIVDTSTVISKQIPKEGLWLSKDSIGVKTVNINNIKIVSSQGFWDSYLQSLLWGGSRMRYKVCDSNKINCQEYTQSITMQQLSLQNLPAAIDLRYNSVYVIAETRATIFNSWTAVSTPGITASFNYDILGIKLYSTTRDPAGATICTTSCDLSCPEIVAREKTDGTGYPKEITNNVLEYQQTAPYLEYWETIDYDLNRQFGATIFNSNTQTFCFAGAVYSSASLTLENGKTYIYPSEATKQIKACCPGAVISGTYEDKICQSDYTWKTINKDTRIACTSSISCPGAGLTSCQNKQSSAWSCNSGFCEKGSNTVVDCCSNSDCSANNICQNNKCLYVGPIPQTPCTSDSQCKAYEQCTENVCVTRNNESKSIIKKKKRRLCNRTS
jgi:hypothetical protein